MISDIVRALVAAGASPEMILGAVEAAERAQTVKEEERLAGISRRMARYRSRGGDKIPEAMRTEVFERDNYECVYCGGNEHLQCDHVVPVSKGGETTLDNLATACRVCNVRKKDRDRKAFLAYSAEFPWKNGNSAEPPPLKKDIKPPVSELRSDTNTPLPKPTPRIELEAILDPEHATAVIDHRQRLGSGLTAHAAKLLAAEFAKCANPNAAADTMIARGWRGFKPKWLEERHNGPAGPPPKPPTGSAKLVELLKKPFEETYGRGNGQDPPGATVLPIRNR